MTSKLLNLWYQQPCASHMSKIHVIMIMLPQWAGRSGQSWDHSLQSAAVLEMHHRNHIGCCHFHLSIQTLCSEKTHINMMMMMMIPIKYTFSQIRCNSTYWGAVTLQTASESTRSINWWDAKGRPFRFGSWSSFPVSLLGVNQSINQSINQILPQYIIQTKSQQYQYT